MNSKFMLLLGVSGVGKTSLIKELIKIDSRFRYISPDVTRPLREGEMDKNSVSEEVMNEKNSKGEYLMINRLFNGIRYGTPRKPITEALDLGRFPVLDWPVTQMKVMVDIFSGRTFSVYLSPPSIVEIERRLSMDGRDVGSNRLKSAEEELLKYWAGEFNSAVDYHIISETDQISQVARELYNKFILSLE